MTSDRPAPHLTLVAGRNADPAAAVSVLLVDDHEMIRTLWKEMLTESLPNVRFMEASNGAHAVWIAHETPPDVILMDLHMPVMSGMDAVKWLKEDDVMRRIPVIAVTGLQFSPDEMISAGCAGYLAKPLSSEQLVREVSRVLGRPLPHTP